MSAEPLGSRSTGDAADLAGRLRALMPARWFPDSAPTLEALLGAMGATGAATFGQILFAQAQTRLRTVSGGFLDMAVRDFRGTRQIRRRNESDDALRARFLPVFRDKATRAALVARLTAISGVAPWVFEPSRPADTGGYRVARGYSAAGGYASLLLPCQLFVSARRPSGQGIPIVAGYGSRSDGAGTPAPGGYRTGAVEWSSLAAEAPHVTDADVYALIADVLPAASIAWVTLGGAPAGGGADLGDFILGVNTIA